MKIYGIAVNLPTKAVSEDYELEHNEKAKITRKDVGTIYDFPEWDKEEVEQNVLDSLISEFNDTAEASLLYASVKATLLAEGRCQIETEVHIQSNHPFGISMAVAIVVLCIGVAFAVWIGVMAYGTYRFIEATGGIGGGLAMALVFILAIVFLLLIFGGKLGISKKGLKIGK